MPPPGCASYLNIALIRSYSLSGIGSDAIERPPTGRAGAGSLGFVTGVGTEEDGATAVWVNAAFVKAFIARVGVIVLIRSASSGSRARATTNGTASAPIRTSSIESSSEPNGVLTASESSVGSSASCFFQASANPAAPDSNSAQCRSCSRCQAYRASIHFASDLKSARCGPSMASSPSAVTYETGSGAGLRSAWRFCSANRRETIRSRSAWVNFFSSVSVAAVVSDAPDAPEVPLSSDSSLGVSASGSAAGGSGVATCASPGSSNMALISSTNAPLSCSNYTLPRKLRFSLHLIGSVLGF